MDTFLNTGSKVIKNNSFLFCTLAGVFAGLILGFGIKPFNPNESIQALLSYPGELFLRALTLLILPTIIFSMIVGSASLDIKSNGKIVLRTFTYFLLTSTFNAIMGLILVISLHPGDISIRNELENVTSAVEERRNSVLENFMDMGRSIIPNNIFTAFFEQPATIYEQTATGEFRKYLGTRPGTNPIGIITYSISVGLVIAMLGDKAKPLLDVAKAFDAVNMKSLTAIIWLTPIGVCSIICGKILEVQNMWAIMTALGYFILSVALGILIYQLIFMQLFYFLIVRKNPFKFYVGVLPAAITGFAADSS